MFALPAKFGNTLHRSQSWLESQSDHVDNGIAANAKIRRSLERMMVKGRRQEMEQ